MILKNIFKLVLIAIFVIGTLNFAYADAGPELGPNQVQKIAQGYLNSHNLPYTAMTPDDRTKDLVMNTKTGQMEWIPNGDEDYNNIDEYVIGPCSVFEVPINNNNGKNIGEIYVDVVGMKGTVIEVFLLPTSKTDADNFMTSNDTSYSANIANMSIVTPLTSQKSSNDGTGLSNTPQNTAPSDQRSPDDTTGLTSILMLILGIAIGLVISVGYLKFSKK